MTLVHIDDTVSTKCPSTRVSHGTKYKQPWETKKCTMCTIHFCLLLEGTVIPICSFYKKGTYGILKCPTQPTTCRLRFRAEGRPRRSKLHHFGALDFGPDYGVALEPSHDLSLLEKASSRSQRTSLALR